MTISRLAVVSVAWGLLPSLAACSSSRTIVATGTDGASGQEAGATAPTAPFTGCDDGRRAMVSGGSSASGGSSDAPRVCSIETGITTPFDATLVVDPSGALLLSPASGISRSHDNGTTWETLDPTAGMATLAGRIHPWIFRDAKTGRVFFNAYDPTGDPTCPALGGPDCMVGAVGCSKDAGTAIWSTDDFGNTWQRSVAGCDDSKDYGKVFSGPATTASSKSRLAAGGYANMVYFCAEGPNYITGPNRQCYRSFDGGKTYARTASDAVDKAGRGDLGFPLAGAVAPDGSIYVTHSSTTDMRLGLSVSHDEGDSWSEVFVPGSTFTSANLLVFLSMAVTTDLDGNVYVSWSDEADLLPYVVASKDGGATWTPKLDLSPPGVAVGIMPNLTADRAGYVAVAYYGSADAKGNGGDGYLASDGREYDAYLTVVSDVFAGNPTLTTGKVNTGDPVIDGESFAVSEYLGPPVFGPDGSIWAAYVNKGQGLVARIIP